MTAGPLTGGRTGARADVVVVGGGAMGLAAAWRLSARGHRVRLLEQHAPGHHHGASHGATRNFNEAYADDDHLRLVARARTLWDALAESTGTAVLDLVGLVNQGPRAGLDAVRTAHGRHGIASRFLPAAEAQERWPGMRFVGDVLHVPGSGRVRAADALAALRVATQALGGEIRDRTPVREVRVLADESVEVVTDDETLHAQRVVVAAGAWTAGLLGDVVGLPPLVVTEEAPAHFGLRTDGPGEDAAAWPSFNQAPDPAVPDAAGMPAPVYGMLTPGEGVKVGFHGTGPVVADPDRRSYLPDPAGLERLQEHVRRWFPGLDAEAVAPISCTYTSTATGDFVLERVGPLVVAAGFSGHGFKFTPAVGETLAGLVDGEQSPARFRPGLRLR